jgi:hypothetical protein
MDTHRLGFSSTGGSANRLGDRLRVALVVSGFRLRKIRDVASRWSDCRSDVVRSWHRGLRYPQRVHIVGEVSPPEMPGYLRAVDAALVPRFAKVFQTSVWKPSHAAAAC